MAFNVLQNLTAKTGFNQTIDLDTPQSFSSFTNTYYWHKPELSYFLHLVYTSKKPCWHTCSIEGAVNVLHSEYRQTHRVQTNQATEAVKDSTICWTLLCHTTTSHNINYGRSVTTGHTIDRHLEPNIQKHCMSNPNKMFLTGILTNSWNAQLVPAIHGVRRRTHFRRRTVYPHTSTWALIAHQRYILVKGFQETQRRWKWLKRFCVERNNGAAKGGRECHREMEIRKGMMGCLRLNNKLGVDCLSILRPRFSLGCALVYGLREEFQRKNIGLVCYPVFWRRARGQLLLPASFPFVCGDFQIIYPTKYVIICGREIEFEQLYPDNFKTQIRT